MRLVRLDHLPGGRSLELHRRLTVLLGAPPGVLGSLTDALRAVAAGGPASSHGQVELHGTLVELQGRTFDLEGAPVVDPVLDLAAPAPLRPVRSGDASRRTRGPQVEMREVDPPAAAVEPHQHDPASRTRTIAADDLVRLRAELRSVEGERTLLDRRAEEVRIDLDSFARATLEVASRQLRSVEERRSALLPEQREPVGDPPRRRSEPEQLDTRAQELADRLVDLHSTAEANRMRRSVLGDLLAAADGRLADARREADEAAARATPAFDVEIVDRLESTRDEILDVERGRDHLDASTQRERIADLRSAEAELLDRLGFETYTAFVMAGVDPERLAPSPDLLAAGLLRVGALEEEVEDLRHELSLVDDAGSDAAARHAVVEDAALLFGAPTDRLTRLTDAELVELLRVPRPVDPPVMTDQREPVLVDDDGGRMADLEAEAQALRRRVAECEERVERHEQATEELAGLRAGELELRERERDLNVRISDRERLLGLLGPDGSGSVATETTPDADVLRRRVERDTSVAWPVDREWQLLARLGEVRSVGTIGSVPLLVAGVDAAASGASALLHRIASMSDLVQMVVASDDERLARWAESLGGDVTLVRW